MAKRTKGRANGEGSIYEYPKGSGKWIAQMYLEDGRARRRRANSQRAAREKLRQMHADYAQGVNLSASQPTVSEWCAIWLETFATNLKPNIRDNYEGVVARYITAAPMGKRRLDKLTPAEVQGWVNQLAKQLAPQSAQCPRAAAQGVGSGSA